MSLPDLLVSVDHPFPGLRPFETAESLLFFGREEHTQDLLRRLGDGRFLAVVGTSGSGKSSLVRAGLLPAVYRGDLVGSTTHWRIAVMRPGTAPLENLCAALADKDALGPDDSGSRLELLQSSSLGLVEVVRDAKLEPGESLLIVADQFEELFRYRRQAATGNDPAEAVSKASLFVSLLLQAAERFDCPVYVVLTMRSDFLGECSQFSGLPEALSRSQYLIPRLSREQRQQAIERPLHLAGIGITQPLIQQLLNDSSDEAASLGDPLPVLQHALMRTCEHWKQAGAQGDLDLEHYDAVGGIKDALNRHAESIYEKLGASGQAWAAKVFRSLTVTEAGRAMRRPTRLDRIYAITGADTDANRREVDAVLRSFLDRENSLLVSSSPEGLQPKAVIDIAHESLIWKWQRLDDWVRREAATAECYVDLVKNVRSFNNEQSGLWRDPALGRALEIQHTEGWNEAWAAQYYPGPHPYYADALRFLRQSRKAQSKERWLRRVGIGVAVIALVASLFYWRRSKEAEENNRTLAGRVGELRNQSERAQSEAQKLTSEADGMRRRLASALSPEERSKLEKQIQEKTDKAEQSQKLAEQLKNQQEPAAKVAASGGELKDVVKAPQERADQADASVKTLQKQLADAQSRNNTLQDSLDTATREAGKLKLQLDDAIKERDALKQAAIPAPVKEPPATAAGPNPGTVRRNPLDKLEYVWIPPGEFQMGCSSGDKACDASEKPQHRVTISNGFWMGQTEVTQSAFGTLMQKAPSHFKGPQLPVDQVPFHDAEQYCKAAGGRLPTEAEWEYAARAGSAAPRYGQLDAVAWYKSNSNDTTHPVKKKIPNAWGLYDMLGNVQEWVTDWSLDTYFRTLPPSTTDPQGPPSGKERGERGGSWLGSPYSLRFSYRDKDLPADNKNNVGFRCVREAIP